MWNTTFVESTGHLETNEQIIITLVLTICLVLGIIGNAIIIVAVLTTRHLRHKPSNVFVLSLCINYIISCMIYIPITIYGTFYRRVTTGSDADMGNFCKFTVTVIHSLAASCVLSLTTISMDRFLSLVAPYAYIKHMNLNLARKIIIYCWLQAVITVLPGAFVDGWYDYEGTYGVLCGIQHWRVHLAYEQFVYCVNLYIPASCLLVVNIVVYMIARKKKRTQVIKLGTFVDIGQNGDKLSADHCKPEGTAVVPEERQKCKLQQLNTASQSKRQANGNKSITLKSAFQQEYHTILSTIVIALFFLISVTPYCIIRITRNLGLKVNPKSFTYTSLIMTGNVVWNPILLLLTRRDFRCLTSRSSKTNPSSDISTLYEN